LNYFITAFSFVKRGTSCQVFTLVTLAAIFVHCSLLYFFVMVMGFTFPVNALCLKAHSFWPTVLLHASHNVFVRSIFNAATVNGPYAQYYQLFLLFVLPIKIRMS